MRELTVSNAEEHEVLGGLLDESAIGSASYSCVYMKLLSEGSGIRILRHNTGNDLSHMAVAAVHDNSCHMMNSP